MIEGNTYRENFKFQKEAKKKKVLLTVYVYVYIPICVCTMALVYSDGSRSTHLAAVRAVNNAVLVAQ